MSDTLEVMMRARSEIEERLLTHPDYRALLAMDRAIAEVMGRPVRNALHHSVHWADRPMTDPSFALYLMPHDGRMSQAEAVEIILKRSGKPMTTAELLPLVKELGVDVGGGDPASTLSSSLSRHKGLKSVRWSGKACWWLSEVEPPDDSPQLGHRLTSAAIREVLKSEARPVSLGELRDLLPAAFQQRHTEQLRRMMASDPHIRFIQGGLWEYVRGPTEEGQKQ